MPFYQTQLPKPSKLRDEMTKAYRMDETLCVKALLQYLQQTKEQSVKTIQLATELVLKVRKTESEKTGVEALMVHYDLSTEEGVLLMCLAEALLRVPDVDTEKLLIKDKLTSANWQKHIGASESSFVNAATWGLALSGKVLDAEARRGQFQKIWYGLLKRAGEPAIRKAVREAIKVMSHQFVVGRKIEEALKHSKPMNEKGYVYSYDMLGEVARTQEDADRYFKAYQDAITTIGSMSGVHDLILGPSISVKLSALHPRYEFSKREVVIPALTKRLKTLVLQAKNAGMSLTVDAEEADRLDLSLDILEAVFSDPELVGWEGMGLAVQAYQKRAFHVINYLIDLARTHKKRIQVRLVKGAYWDSEIKLSQVMGFSGYPVFTRKTSTDVSYLTCAKLMLNAQDAIYPQFATHNAYSVAAILTMMGDYHQYQFEFQNLQGMGKSLHDIIVGKNQMNIPCRIYAPVGSHENLLPYLVRRLLENGANSSFVNQLSDESMPIEKLVADPIAFTESLPDIPNSKIPLPKNIYGSERVNSAGIDLSNHQVRSTLEQEMEKHAPGKWRAAPFHRTPKQPEAVSNPANRQEIVGYVEQASTEDVEHALVQATKAFTKWDELGVQKRADILLKMGELLEAHYAELMMMAVKEAGKVLPDAIAEVREATDFCRYYSMQARKTLATETLPGPTGEANSLHMQGRGVMLCISPWNFPIAIFTGQVAAALVAGNTVIAKPAEQTPLVAAKVVELFHQAGVPKEALILMPGLGETVGAALVKDERIAGVLFTGSTSTAKAIQKSLADRAGPIVPFVAETGGINAMIADSTALPEQLVRDVIMSAFGSAGQRCSALRVLMIQDEIADSVIKMLAGAMHEMTVNDPYYIATDVGPVIDEDARQMLEKHAAKMKQEARLIYEVAMRDGTQGTFVTPKAFELASLSMLNREIFGPILHVVRFKRQDLDKVIDEINGLGYGLTFGIQSRINDTVDYILSRISAGNIYVNRNMIGAVVGVQPFGGNGLSGTGPKAGGPHYLSRLCREATVSIDTTAAGGNASLMALAD